MECLFKQLERGLLALLVLAVCGCSRLGTKVSNPLLQMFPSTSRISPRGELGLEQYDVLEVNGIKAYKDCFLMKTNNSETGFCLLNLQDDKVLKFFNKGRGKGEFSYFRSFEIQDDTMWVADPNLRRLYAFDLKNVVAGDFSSLVEQRPIEKPDGHMGMYMPIQMIPTKYGFLAFGYMGGTSWYSLLGKGGEVLGQVGLPDFAATENFSVFDKEYIGSTSYCSVHPDGDRMVCAMLNADAISFASIGNGTLSEYKRYILSEPPVEMVDGKVAHRKDATHSFFCACSNEKSVFLLYSGKPILGGDTPVSECTELLEFNWDGEPVKRYILNETICGLCFQGNTLYGCTSYPGAKIYVYDLQRQ